MEWRMPVGTDLHAVCEAMNRHRLRETIDLTRSISRRCAESRSWGFSSSFIILSGCRTESMYPPLA